MYAFNITDDWDLMLRHLDTVVKHGGNCVMVSINSIGLAGVAHLRKHAPVCIHGHRNQWGMLSRCPSLGMSFTPYQKLCRLVGVDHLHVNGLNNKFYESNASVIGSVRECLTPMREASDTVLPVLSSKQWAGAAPETYRTLQTVDLMNIAGGGIHGHPGGPGAGFPQPRTGLGGGFGGHSARGACPDAYGAKASAGNLRVIKRDLSQRKEGDDLRICYYGDDFTGSTDVLEALTGRGLRIILFMNVPDPAEWNEKYAGYDGFGVAGVGRTMSPAEMERMLRPVVSALREFGAPVTHYKICSTFDSSPETGSIGKVADIGREAFPEQRCIPVVAGCPVLGRYTVFGNHFAGAGAKSSGSIGIRTCVSIRSLR
ncbi:hypothetical protein LJK88_17365 [Paenibacillus sp. P26]|nr:hypothetical protein LJK88_17365 [Paenibacillus sp. P26]